MGKNTCAARSYFHHYFLVFGYPGETLALVVHMLHKDLSNAYACLRLENNFMNQKGQGISTKLDF